MDELKLLIEMVANLPTLAVWVLVGYLVYKIVVVGSIYGLVRFGIDKLHSWLTKPKHEMVVLDAKLRSMTLEDCQEDLFAQLERLKNITNTGKAKTPIYCSSYIHKHDVDVLREGLDIMIQKIGEKNHAP